MPERTNQPQKRPNSKKSRTQNGEALDRASADLLRNVPPQNLEAEQAVLGGVFQTNSLFHSLVDVVSPEDFYSPVHQTIFQTFIDLYNKNTPIDLITVSDWLRTKGVLDELGGPVYLAELADSPVSSANASRHAHIVRDKAILRDLIQTASDIISNCYDAQDVDALLDEAEKSIFEIADAKTTGTIANSRDLVNSVFDELTKRFENKSAVTGIKTGYQKYDDMTAGLQKSDLIIVAGRPSMGKTAFALNLGLRAALNEAITTAVFSLEMSKEQLMTRLLACQGRVNLGNLRTGYLQDEDWLKLHNAANDLSSSPLFIDDTPALSTLELRARCRRLKAEHNLGLVVVDYLQLMRSSRKIDSREQEISDISRSLKALAKELNIPVIALSQLNRKVEERKPPRPMLSDLRESGAIEQDADVILFLYRDDFYNQNEDNPKKNMAEVIIGKQRNGPIGDVDLYFHKQWTRFEDLTTTPYPSENGPTA
ncbi:replicative DNA helicase [Paucidesulfovibrio gracilis DSM 16080]|uniref:Replicative DNA helicase n=1 Tax=Paucidesulfovibrio gracilis DSM 16080 TaxID=1121449 RepID=A0A1T4WKU1_9BACT|nr:replicative DNA helicase [Paucidesulfovibrio gracilis]SKA77767.1 replicative DNA helicase [Paucidesulfovibrio gracilis DSM 16080]